LRLANKLRLHMAHVRDLINAYTAAAALVNATQASGSAAGLEALSVDARPNFPSFTE